MNRIQTAIISYLAILVIIGSVVTYIKHTDYSSEYRVNMQTRRVDCSLGQIPLDCVRANKNGPKRQPTNKETT